MGASMDYLGPLAQPRLEREHLDRGLLTPEQVANWLLLREVMTGAGFRVLAIEWWHFEAWDVRYVRSHFPVVEDF
jgi:D-alanyl-D-alanine dipeptidase